MVPTQTPQEVQYTQGLGHKWDKTTCVQKLSCRVGWSKAEEVGQG